MEVDERGRGGGRSEVEDGALGSEEELISGDEEEGEEHDSPRTQLIKANIEKVGAGPQGPAWTCAGAGRGGSGLTWVLPEGEASILSPGVMAGVPATPRPAASRLIMLPPQTSEFVSPGLFLEGLCSLQVAVPFPSNCPARLHSCPPHTVGHSHPPGGFARGSSIHDITEHGVSTPSFRCLQTHNMPALPMHPSLTPYAPPSARHSWRPSSLS